MFKNSSLFGFRFLAFKRKVCHFLRDKLLSRKYRKILRITPRELQSENKVLSLTRPWQTLFKNTSISRISIVGKKML